MNPKRFPATTWHGTADELQALVKSIFRNCSCETTPGGARLNTCSLHEMMGDQRALDGFLFVRRMRARLALAEFGATDQD